MLMLLIAGLLVVFPALVVVLWYIDRPMWILPAAVSFAINLLPFIVAILVMRAMKRKGHDVEADAH
jgi:Mn2+/Fe2+ NRAMP family transporter